MHTKLSGAFTIGNLRIGECTSRMAGPRAPARAPGLGARGLYGHQTMVLSLVLQNLHSTSDANP